MSKIVTTSIIIDGTDFLPQSGYSITIQQSLGTHSTFNVIFQTNATEGYGGSLMDNSLDFVGKKIAIGIDQGAMEFKGIITSLDVQKSNNASGIIILSGYSASIVLSKSVQCFSYEEGSSFSQIVNDTINGHNTDVLKMTLGSGTDIKLPYTVQYNESDFNFLQRLCSRFGVWLYDNGKELCIGRSGQQQLQGVYGEDIQAFHLSTALQEQAFGLKTHDWVNNSPLEADSSAFAATSSHPYMSTIKGESDTVFAKKGNYNWLHDQVEYHEQKGVDLATKVSTLGKASNMITASGSSELASLRVGDTLAIEGLNFSDANKKDVFGSYIITKLTHRFNHSGHYSNDFEGVPEGTEHPPYSNIFNLPKIESQRGLVFDNADPEGLGRIKVQFGWQQAKGTTTPWIKMTTPYSGAEKGFYFIPELEEEVLVGFEGSDPERPYILSAGFNKTANSTFADPDNNIKAIKTRSGHLIEFNDTEGEEAITITDKNSNKILLNTKDSSISITAPANLSLTADTIDIKAKKALTITSEEATIDVKSKEATTMESTNATMSMTGKENVNIQSSDAEVEVKAKTIAKLDSEDSIAITATSEVKAHGGGKTKISGGKVEINQG